MELRRIGEVNASPNVEIKLICIIAPRSELASVRLLKRMTTANEQHKHCNKSRNAFDPW
jgi:hypothetical protein